MTSTITKIVSFIYIKPAVTVAREKRGQYFIGFPAQSTFVQLRAGGHARKATRRSPLSIPSTVGDPCPIDPSRVQLTLSETRWV